LSGIGVGVVGLGALGLDQAEMCRGIEGVSVVKGADISEAARERARAELDIETFSDAGELLDDPAVGLAVISTSNAAHVEPTLAALERGKAVLLQKPMALSPADCARIVEAAERAGVFLQVGFECRYSLLYTRVREIADSGEIGEVRDVGMEYCPGMWPIWFEQEGGWKYLQSAAGGMVLEKLSHYVDLVRWYVGEEVREVRTVTPGRIVPHFEIMDNLRVIMIFAGGATGAIHFSFTRSPASEQDSFKAGSSKLKGDFIDLSLTGTEGSLSFNRWFRELNVVLYRREGAFRPWRARAEDYTGTDLARLMHDNATELADVVRRVRESRPPYTPARDSLQTMRVCFAAEESAVSGKSVFL
jgi:predicted dehydrogenase